MAEGGGAAGGDSRSNGAAEAPNSPLGGFGGLSAPSDRSPQETPPVLTMIPEPALAASSSVVHDTVEWWRRVTATPLSMSSTNVNLTDTLPVMEGRKSLRRFRGAYQRTRPVLAWFMFLLLLTIWTFTSSSFDGSTVSATFSLRVGVSTNSQLLYFLLLGLLLLYMLFSIRVMTQYNLAFSWVITGVFVLISMVVVVLAAHSPQFSNAYLNVRDVLVVAFLLVQAAYLVSCYLLRHILPYLQMRGYFLIKTVLLDEQSTPDLQRMAAAIPQDPRYRALPATGRLASSTFKYVQVLLPIFRVFVPKRDHISYSGEVDAAGRPHGYGLWTDSHWHGETLEGWWSRGCPIAPFKSRETGSGSGFVCTRIGYFQCRQDAVTAMSFLPRGAPLSVGVASAECSVSGFFFRDYPLIRFLTDPKTPGAVQSEADSAAPGATASCAAEAGAASPRSDSSSVASSGGGGVALPALKAAVEWMLGLIVLMDDKQEGSSSVVITANPHRGLRAGGFIQPEVVRTVEGGNTVTSITVRAVHEGEATPRSSAAPPCERAPHPAALLMSPKRSLSMHATAGTPPPVNPRACAEGVLRLDGWQSCYAADHREAILYIHGYNSPLEWGVKGLGQLIALGNFPSYLKPFVFSWPTGQLFAFLAAKRGASTAETVQAFIDALKGLDQAGFRRVHILTHSMGVRTLLKALPQLLSLLSTRQAAGDKSPPGASSPAGEPGASADRSSGSWSWARRNASTGALSAAAEEEVTLLGGLSIATITMLNPEYPLCEFLRSCAKSLRTICPLVTIYGDMRDTALFGAELWNALDATFIDRANQRKQRSNESGVADGSGSLPIHNDGMEEDGTCCCGGIISERALGNHLYNIKGAFGEPLDIDIIDTTFLEANVHNVRHNAFSLNRDIVEDLRDIITTFRRASQRPRLEARGGNVFSFMVAPAHVVQPS